MHSKVIGSGAVAVSLALVLAACGNGGAPGGTTTYKKVGSFGVTTVGTGKTASGVFYKVPNGIAVPNTVTGQTEDTCTVQKFSQTEVPVQPSPGSDQQFSALDAGAALTLKQGTNTLATVPKSQTLAAANLVLYIASSGIPADLSGATLDIPGAADGFPATTVALPADPGAFTISPKTNITKDTAFTWDNSSAGASMVLGTFQTVGTNTVYVSCLAKDDGSFAFPDATKTAMTANGFTSSGFLTANKTVFTTKAQGDALLIVGFSRSSN